MQQHQPVRHDRQVRPGMAQRKVVGLQPAEQPAGRGIEVQSLDRRGDRQQRLPPPRPAGEAGAVQPGAGVERIDHRPQHADIRTGRGPRRHGQRPPETRRTGAEVRGRHPDWLPPRCRAHGSNSPASRAAAGSRCSGWRELRRVADAHRPALPSDCRTAGRDPVRSSRPGRRRRAARHSRGRRPAPASPAGRWRRNRRRSRPRRRPGRRSGPIGVKACSGDARRRCAAASAACRTSGSRRRPGRPSPPAA